MKVSRAAGVVTIVGIDPTEIADPCSNRRRLLKRLVQ
jgi:hypothetical protein